MRSFTGREFIGLLEMRGWVLLRVNGSHHILGKVGNPMRISVPVHGARPLKSGLVRHLARLAEIGEDELR